MLEREESIPARSQSEGDRLVANSLYGIMARVVDFVLRFAALAWIARYLGSFSYGDFALVTAVAAFIQVFVDFGMEPIVQREINIRPREKEEILSTSMTLRALLSAIFLATLVGSGPILGIPAALRTVLFFEATAQAFVAFQILLLGVIRAHEQTRYDLLTTVFYHVVMLLLVAFAIVLNFGLIWIFVARCLAELVKLGLMGVLVHRRFVPLHFSLDIDRSMYLIKEGLPILVLSFFTVATVRVNVFILRLFHDSTEVAFFDFPLRLVTAVTMIPLMVVFACFPALCRAADESKAALAGLYEEIFKVLLLLSLPLSAIVIAGGDWGIELIGGDEYIPAGLTLRIFGAMLPAVFLMPLLNFTLTAAGRQRLNIIGAATGLAVNVGVAMLLVPSQGFPGAAVAMVIGNMLGLFVTWAFVSRFAVHLQPWKLAGPPLVAAVPMFGVCLALKGFGWMGLAAGFAVGTALFVFILWRLGVLRVNDFFLIVNLLQHRRKQRKSSQELSEETELLPTSRHDTP